jgi:hypothetical protein
VPRGAPFSRGLFFLGRPLVYISPHHHYHHKPANRWNIINFNFFSFSQPSAVYCTHPQNEVPHNFSFDSSQQRPRRHWRKKFGGSLLHIFFLLLFFFFTMALNERLRYDELCQSFIGVPLDHDRSASRARLGARSMMRKKVHCRVFLYIGWAYVFLLKGNKNWTALFFEKQKFFFSFII